MKLKFFLPFLLLSCLVSNYCHCLPSHTTYSKDYILKAKQSLLKNRTRTDLINYLIASRGYQSYLELGVAGGENLAKINVTRKIGVDPNTNIKCDYHLTSDAFFQINREKFDIIFIDGLHLYEQVLRDIENGLQCMNPGGVIVMHDCMPVLPEHQLRSPVKEGGAWNGDVWKAAAFVRMHLSHVHFCVLDMDWGCGIITPNASQELFHAYPIETLNWDFYQAHKEKLLNVMQVEEWLLAQK